MRANLIQTEEPIVSELLYHAEKKGISMIELARACNISPAVITKLRLGQTKRPIAPYLYKMANHLGLEIALIPMKEE